MTPRATHTVNGTPCCTPCTNASAFYEMGFLRQDSIVPLPAGSTIECNWCSWMEARKKQEASNG